MKNQEECISDFVAKNILERLRTLVKNLSRPCSVDEPLVVLIITSAGGVVQRVGLRDPRYEVLPSLPGEGADVCRLLQDAGFGCEVRRRIMKPPKAKVAKGAASPPPPPSHSPPVVELLFLVYPAA